MSRANNPDRTGIGSQPENAKDAEKETDAERLGSDVRSNDGVGVLFRRGAKSETEQALERAHAAGRGGRS